MTALRATRLPEDLAEEIAALPAFKNYWDALVTINGTPDRLGVRVKYMNLLHKYAAEAKLSDPFVQGIGTAIALACDRAIALMAHIGDREKHWTGSPVSSLTDEERKAL